MLTTSGLEQRLAPALAERLRERNATSRAFFAREAPRLAVASSAIAERFLSGGRMFAFGRGPYATDAQHVAVEFVHPVIVGKRALPAIDASLAGEAGIAVLAEKDDIVIGFGPPEGDSLAQEVLTAAHRRGAFTVALPGTEADYGVPSPSAHPHIHQELFEVLGHTLYESVHVFLEHRDDGGDVGPAAFLYPYLGSQTATNDELIASVAASIVAKAADADALRERIAAEQAEGIAAATVAIFERLHRGGKLLMFGNGGSATDATDWALDCIDTAGGERPVRALSLASEPAVITAIGNDVGGELIFVRQLCAHARPPDVAVALSTSGGSANVLAALTEARKRGLLTVALLGYDGGETARRGLADHTLVVNCDYIPRIQEAHGAIYHAMREGLTLLFDGA